MIERGEHVDLTNLSLVGQPDLSGELASWTSIEARASLDFPSQSRNPEPLSEREQQTFLALYEMKAYLNSIDAEVMHGSFVGGIIAGLSQRSIARGFRKTMSPEVSAIVEEIDQGADNYFHACEMVIEQAQEFFGRLAQEGRLFAISDYVSTNCNTQDFLTKFFINNTTGDWQFAERLLNATDYFDGNLGILLDGNFLYWSLNPFAGETRNMNELVAKILLEKKDEIRELLVEEGRKKSFGSTLQQVTNFDSSSREVIERLAELASYCDVAIPERFEIAVRFSKLEESEKGKADRALRNADWDRIRSEVQLERGTAIVDKFSSNIADPETALDALRAFHTAYKNYEISRHHAVCQNYAVTRVAQSLGTLAASNSEVLKRAVDAILSEEGAPLRAALIEARKRLPDSPFCREAREYYDAKLLSNVKLHQYSEVASILSKPSTSNELIYYFVRQALHKEQDGILELRKIITNNEGFTRNLIKTVEEQGKYSKYSRMLARVLDHVLLNLDNLQEDSDAALRDLAVALYNPIERFFRMRFF